MLEPRELRDELRRVAALAARVIGGKSGEAVADDRVLGSLTGKEPP